MRQNRRLAGYYGDEYWIFRLRLPSICRRTIIRFICGVEVRRGNRARWEFDGLALSNVVFGEVLTNGLRFEADALLASGLVWAGQWTLVRRWLV